MTYHSRWLIAGMKSYIPAIAPLIKSIPNVAVLYPREEVLELMTTSFIASNLEALGRDVMEVLTNGTLSHTTCFQNVEGMQYCDSFHLVSGSVNSETARGLLLPTNKVGLPHETDPSV